MTRTPAPFGRVLTAMVTPFTDSGELDLDAAAALASWLVDQGNDGLVVNGTTGESPTTTRQEQAELVRAVVDAVGDRAHVVAGVGSNDTAHTVELSQDAAKAGAAGLLSVTPYYSRPPDDGLVAHYERSAAATDLPVMLYDIPGRTGRALSHEVLLRLAEHPQIVAVKDAKDDVAATALLLAATDYAVYSGTDALNLPLLSVGAVGMVSVVSHVVTRQLVELVDAYERGDVDRARAVNRSLQPVYTGMFRTQGVILAKAALRLLGRPVGPVRLPLVDATPEQVAQLRSDLQGVLELEGAAA
ncbi:MAG TPA: 4-hydroxy-tetrahydrodipicolinate synthase [Mycobacteriales bacterium]|jgi:4-hydroxy-tetrahydrodipicolinate synthase|nr:4-hydroxy-tetrahydrodipicolinate synthase [Mycobacteriales bacterium]